MSTDSFHVEPATEDTEKRIKRGFWAAVAATVLCLANLPWNPPGALVLAGIYAAGAYGIRRRSAWSGYGCALFSLLSVIVALVLAVVSPGFVGPAGASLPSLVANLTWTLSIGFLLFRAGQASAASGGSLGVAWPWWTISGLLILFFVCYRLFLMPAGSMENTLIVGDRVLARTVLVSSKRGSLIVFRYPVDHKQVFVKRIIGVGGDRIRIRDKRLFVNGAAMSEPYVRNASTYVDSYRDNFPSQPNTMIYPQALKMLEENVQDGELVVPPNRYFVLGDNRDVSLDSRYWGFVSSNEVIGTPILIYYSVPLNSSGVVGERSVIPPLGRIRWDRFFQPVH